MGFISAVPENQRPALFQSLLYEACGRTVNPVYGAVGLLWSGNWSLCQGAVDTVLKGGAIRPSSSLQTGSKLMQSLPGVPQTTSPRLKLTIAPDIATAAQPAPDASFSMAHDIEAVRPKRPVDESHSGATERAVVAGSSHEIPQFKRYRNGEQETKERTLGCTDAHHQQLSAFILRSAPWPLKPEEPQQPTVTRDVAEPSGQLIAPVPRRVRPRNSGEAQLIIDCPRSLGGQASREELVRAVTSENIGLDLTLNSHMLIPPGRTKLGSVRVSSPSTISANSEGSVTSLDTTELSIARWPARSPSPREEQNFLHLLQ